MDKYKELFAIIRNDVEEGRVPYSPLEWLQEVFPDQESIDSFVNDWRDTLSDCHTPDDIEAAFGMYFNLGWVAHREWGNDAS